MPGYRNPFIIGGPVPPECFIGRERDVEAILDRLANPAHGSTAVSGEARIGKTSLLHYISSPQTAEEWGLSPEECTFIFVDGQSVVPFSPMGFWRHVLKSLAAREVHDPDYIDGLLKGDDIGGFELSELFDRIARGGKLVVLLIDGFEYVVEHVSPDNPGLLYLLRGLINRPAHGLALVITSREPLHVLCQNVRFVGSPFPISFALLSLDPLSPKEANQLIEIYAQGTDVTFSSRDREFAYEISKGHPYQLQKVCFELFERHKEKIRMGDGQFGLLDESDYKAIAAELEAEEFAEIGRYAAVAAKEPETISEEKVKRPVVLHLSDLQFGPQHAFGDDQKALDKLKEDIDRYEQEGIPRPNIIIVSGDLADTGGAKGDEYGATARFLEGLCQHLSVDRRYVVLVPGNHDVDWDEARRLEALEKRRDRGLTAAIEKLLFWLKSEPAGSYVCVKYLERFGKYIDFYNRFYRKGNGTTYYTYDLMSEEGFNIIYNFHPEWEIAFLALNSCEKEDHHDENHYGHISPSVLVPTLKRMKTMIPTTCVKAAVFHHNALAGGGEDRLRNFRSDILPALSQAGFSLVLHGHTHKPDVDDLGPELTGGTRVRVVGAGSVSVARAQRPGSDRVGQVPNQYWVLAFELGEERRQFTAYARQYDPNLAGRYTRGKWIPYNIFIVAGKSSDRKTFEIGTT